MKKKFLAYIMTLCMLVGLVPTTAMAAEGNVAQIGDNVYTSLQEAFDAAVTGDTITLLDGIDGKDWASVDVKKAIIIDGNEKTINGLTAPLINNASADLTIKNLTITGANIEVKSAAGKDNDTSAAALVQWVNGGTLELNNVSVKNSIITGDGYVAALVGFVDSTAAGVKVDGGEISGNTLTAGGTVGTVAGHTYADVTVEGVKISKNTLTSNSDGGTRPDKVGLVVGRLSADTVSISATVEADNTVEPKGTNEHRVLGSIPGGTAIIEGGSYPSDPSVIGGGTNEVTFPAGKEPVKNKDGTWSIDVDLSKYVAEIDGVYYETLQEALNYAAATTNDVEVVLLRDVDLKDVDWNPVRVVNDRKFTLDGAGFAITNLDNMLFASTYSVEGPLVIKNLTIKDSKISNDIEDVSEAVAVGAFIGDASTATEIILENCHLVDSKVEGGRWTGGLVGVAGGYSEINNGPVFETLTITGCSVKDCEISGKGSVGGVMGHAAWDAWTLIKIDAVVKGNTITSTGDSKVKAGIVMGTVGAAGTETHGKTGGVEVNVTETGNAATSNGTEITTVYGRQGTATGVLTITGGEYDNNPLKEEDEAWAKPAKGYAIVQNPETNKYVLGKEIKAGVVVLEGEATLNEDGSVTVDKGAVVIVDGEAVEFPDGGTIKADGTVVPNSKPSKPSSGSSKPKYDITVEDADNGEVKSSTSRSRANREITITVTPDKGYELDELTIETEKGKEIDFEKGSKAGTFVFDMPRADVVVEASFEKADDVEETPEEDEDVSDETDKALILTIGSKIISVDGEYIVYDVAPVIKGERTMLPIRVVAEYLGADVEWDDAADKVTITKGELVIEIFINQPFATVNGTPVQLDAPAFIENGRTYLPLRFVAENLGATVTWDGNTNTVTIVPAK